jgi:hypothetical protein
MDMPAEALSVVLVTLMAVTGSALAAVTVWTPVPSLLIGGARGVRFSVRQYSEAIFATTELDLKPSGGRSNMGGGDGGRNGGSITTFPTPLALASFPTPFVHFLRAMTPLIASASPG